MAKFEWNVEQGSIEWFKMRSGIPTASEFDKIMTPKTMKPAEARWKYGCRLVAEHILNWQAESLDQIKHIQEGKANEPYAVGYLEVVQEIKTTPVGFVRTNDLRFGASPDRVFGISADRGHVNGVLEIKSPTIPKQMEYLLLGHDDAYRCQVQGQLWVAEADKAIFCAHNPRTPAYVVETGRDEAFLVKLEDCLERFSDELSELMERAKSLGVFQSFAELRTPVDAELGDNIRRDPLTTAEELADIIEGRSGDPSWGG